jgi:hypothetical protein
MFYAIVDRARYEVTLNNGCISLLDSEGRPGPPHYYFSISSDLLEKRPWRTGYVYLLPAEGFVEQPSGPYGRPRCPRTSAGEPRGGRTTRTCSGHSGRLPVSRAHSRP